MTGPHIDPDNPDHAPVIYAWGVGEALCRLVAISAMLGHTNIAHTMDYIHSDPDPMQDVVHMIARNRPPDEIIARHEWIRDVADLASRQEWLLEATP